MPGTSTHFRIGRTEHDPKDIANVPHEGDERPPAHHDPDPLTQIVLLPHALFELAREFHVLAGRLEDAFAREWWDNVCLSNQAVTANNAQGYLQVWSAENGVAVRLRGVVVGCSVAATLQLAAVKTPQYAPGPNLRILATARTTTTQLTVAIDTPLLLAPGESLVVVDLTGSTDKVDFSAEFCRLRSQ